MQIKDGTSFNTILDNTTFLKLEEALDYHNAKLEAARQLQNKIPLFLDTNILLRGYSLTPDRRQMLYDFFTDVQDQIVISKQVQEEFIRNRTEIRKSFAHSPEAQISDLSDALASLMLDLKKEDDQENDDTPDDLMGIYNGFEKIDNLSSEEKTFLIQEFKQNQQNIKATKIGKQPEAPLPFPGMGDIIEKPSFPYGDYFLFHEMLKHTATHETDVVFLTFDVAKEDWLQKDKTAHQHYIYKTYSLNKKAIFILDANAFFEEKFATSFEGLIPTPQKRKEIKPKTNDVQKSELEKELTVLFLRLEKTLRRIARKFDIPADEGIPTKRVLDDLNYDDIISDPVYYELQGIWSVRESLMDENLDRIRRNYTVEELRDILIVIKENSSRIGRL